MGLKLRMMLALTGLGLSSMFGVNMLAGVKDYVDTTGNIMVDIADGIGMVSKGIEALEYWLDPGSETPSEPPTETPSEAVPPAPAGGETPPPPPQDPDQPKVFCQKGKCYPYDPNRMKNSNLNLEMKPDPPAAQQRGKQHQNKRQRKQREEVEEEEEVRSRPGVKVSQEMIEEEEISPSDDNVTGVDVNNTTATNSTMQGTKRLLSSVRNLLDVSSKVIVKLVYKIFPWNRRARRRVLGDGEEEEL